MAQKKSTGKRAGMVGCGTMEEAFKQNVRKTFGKREGVVGIRVYKDKIVIRVVSEDVAAGLPKSYRRRPIETVVVGTISKQAPTK